MTDTDDQLELPSADATVAEKQAQLREAVLAALLAGQEDTIEKRVAIVLNRFPESRDSDIKLMLRYWEQFEGYEGGAIDPADLFVRARLPSLIRARARIQNQF